MRNMSRCRPANVVIVQHLAYAKVVGRAVRDAQRTVTCMKNTTCAACGCVVRSYEHSTANGRFHVACVENTSTFEHHHQRSPSSLILAFTGRHSS